MKTLFFYFNQNLLLDASAIFQNPVLLCLIFTVALYLTFQAAKAYERFNRYRSINNLFDNVGGGYQQRAAFSNPSTNTGIRTRKKGMPGLSLSIVVILSLIVIIQYQQQTTDDHSAVQAHYSEDNPPSHYTSDRPTQVPTDEPYVNQSPSHVADKQSIQEHEYKPEQDFIPPSAKETPALPEDYKVQHASIYSPTATSIPNTPLFTIQITSASDHYQVRTKAYDYSQDFPEATVFTYQEGGITKLFIGQYYSEKEMRSALQQFRKALHRGAFPINLSSIDVELLESTY